MPGRPISNAARVNGFGAVNIWLLLTAPAERRRLFAVSTTAQCVTVPLVFTVPSVTAVDVTLRPDGERAAGEPNTACAAEAANRDRVRHRAPCRAAASCP